MQLTEAGGDLLRRPTVSLRRAQLQRLLGTAIDPARVTATLAALGMQVRETPSGWEALPS